MTSRAVACAALLAAALATGGDARAAPAKHKSRCQGRAHAGHVKARHARCATLRRVRVREVAGERLTALDPGTIGTDPGGSGGGGSGGGGSGGGGSTPAPGRFVSVSAREWSFTLSRPLVGAGSVTIELRNVGEDPHNLVVSPDDGSHLALAGWTDTSPGATQRRSVTLGPGRYQLWCSLAGHEQQGMTADLVVE